MKKSGLSRCLTALALFGFLLVPSSARTIETGITGYEEKIMDQGGGVEALGTKALAESNRDFDQNSLQAAPEAPESRYPEIKVDTLTGDTRLACEAILCLSSPVRPGECTPALTRYFSISFDDWGDTVRARHNFLNQCPSAGADSNMISLTGTLSAGAGLCTIDKLNNRGYEKTDSTNVKLNYNQCRSAGSKSITAPTGKRMSERHTWIEPESDEDSGRSRGYCERTRTYWVVNEDPPRECLNLWNHLYTDFSQRPHLVKGMNPWETHWAE